MIRAVRPTDVVALGVFQTHAHAIEITAPVWPRPSGQRTLVSFMRLVAQALAQPGGRRGMWVSLERGLVQALAVAAARARGLVWDVETLLSEPSAIVPAARLLDYVAVQAALCGARRVFMEADPEGSGAEMARRAGFERYASCALYAHHPPHHARDTGLGGLRRRKSADEHALFQLYKAAVPLRVRAAQAMTADEWSALHSCARQWSPTALQKSHQQYVWERDGILAAWLDLRRRQKTQLFSLVVHPQYEQCAEQLALFAMSRADPRLPLYWRVWDYQFGVTRAADELGFQVLRESDCYVRQLPVRVPSPRLVTAKIAGGV